MMKNRYFLFQLDSNWGTPIHEIDAGQCEFPKPDSEEHQGTIGGQFGSLTDSCE